MKIHGFVAAATLMTIFLAASSANAQNGNGARLTASIPFEFTVQGKTLPAGEYTITAINPASSTTVLRLSQKSGRGIITLQTNAIVGKQHDQFVLIFRRYGDQYFLSEAWTSWSTNGLAILKSRAERELENNPIGSNRKTSTVAIKLKR